MWHAQREENFKAFIGRWCQSRQQGGWYRKLRLELKGSDTTHKSGFDWCYALFSCIWLSILYLYCLGALSDPGGSETFGLVPCLLVREWPRKKARWEKFSGKDSPSIIVSKMSLKTLLLLQGYLIESKWPEGKKQLISAFHGIQSSNGIQHMTNNDKESYPSNHTSKTEVAPCCNSQIDHSLQWYDRERNEFCWITGWWTSHLSNEEMYAVQIHIINTTCSELNDQKKQEQHKNPI